MNIEEPSNTKKTKEVRAWSIYDRDGDIITCYIDRSPQGAFCYFTNMENRVRDKHVSWEELQAEGYSCREILIKEVD